MGSLEEVASTSARGGFTLLVGNSISLLVSAAGAILVARMLSLSEYGLFGVSQVLPGLFFLLSDWGVNSALVRFIAQYRSDDRAGRIKELWKVGFIFKLAVGGILSLTLFLFADVLATVLLRRPEAGGLVRAASLIVLSQSMFSTAISVLTGMERMDYRSAVNVSQAVVKGVCSPLLVYFGYGVLGAVIGQVLSYIVAASIGFLLTVLSSSRLEYQSESMELNDSLRLILGFGMPLFLGSLVSGFASRLQGFLLVWFVSDEVIGNYNAASRFTSLVGLVTGAIGVTLFPAFSKFSHTTEPEKTRDAFQGSVKYSAIVVLPLTLLLVAMSKQVIYTFFTAKYPQAPFLFQLLLVPILLVGVGSLSIGTFLNSQGDTGTTMKINLTASVVSILLSPVLVWKWSALGLIVSVILSEITRSLFGLLVLHRKYSIHPDIWRTERIVLCSTVSAGVAYGVLQVLSALTPFISLLIGSVFFLITYLVLAPIAGAIQEKDVENLDSMLRGLRIIYPIARLLLDIEEKILGFTVG
jgi:O-antigen/teichoic acid export membrane protein